MGPAGTPAARGVLVGDRGSMLRVEIQIRPGGNGEGNLEDGGSSRFVASPMRCSRVSATAIQPCGIKRNIAVNGRKHPGLEKMTGDPEKVCRDFVKDFVRSASSNGRRGGAAVMLDETGIGGTGHPNLVRPMISAVEQPSLLESVIRLPGALLRLPTSALAALEAVNGLAERMDRLITMLDRLEGGVDRAGSGIDLAASGISLAVSGLEQAVGLLDRSLPNLSDSADALRVLTERLSSVAIDLATELPKATQTLQQVAPELSSVVGSLDERFDHIDTVVTELARVVESVVGAIPGMRRVIRSTSTEPPSPPSPSSPPSSSPTSTFDWK
jgi:hypothetical protein